MKLDYRIILIFFAAFLLAAGMVGWKLHKKLHPVPDFHSGKIEVLVVVDPDTVYVTGSATNPKPEQDNSQVEDYTVKVDTSYTEKNYKVDFWAEFSSRNRELKWAINIISPRKEIVKVIVTDTLFIPVEKIIKIPAKIPWFSPAVVGGYGWSNIGNEGSAGVGMAIKKTAIPFLEIDTRKTLWLKCMIIF